MVVGCCGELKQSKSTCIPFIVRQGGAKGGEQWWWGGAVVS